jgi:hypothetical protein
VSAGQNVGPLDREGRCLIQPPLPPDEATWALAAAAGISTVGLRPSFVIPAAAHSHPDCRAILILIVAPHKYAIRLPANRVLQERIGYLLKRPVGRPSLDVRRSYANFTYQAGSWSKPRRVVAKVEWHPGELYPRVGFIVTNMARPAENVVAFYNKRGTCEQRIKEGKGAICRFRRSRPSITG